MKIKFTILIVIIYALSVFANENIIGIKGGLSLYQTNQYFGQGVNSYNIYFGLRTGASVTIFEEIAENKYLYHGLQLSYYQAGGESHDNYNIVINYIGLGYNFIFKYPLKQFNPYLSAGISVDYLINKKEYSNYNGIYTVIDPPNSEVIQKVNLRPIISIGTEYDLNKFKLLIEYVFSYNLLPYIKNDPNFTLFDLKYMTNGHIFNVGIKFNI